MNKKNLKSQNHHPNSLPKGEGKQRFSKDTQEKFLNYFKSKNTLSLIEKEFFEKTYKYVNLIKWLPWLEMIAIWNSLSMNAWTKESDIDLFIITKNNTMWFVRIIITFIFQILWVRKTAKKHAWRFCLSFFCTKSWMNFSKWKLENDVYLYFWIIYLKPILNYNNTYEKFLNENNKWADFTEYNDIIKENKKFIRYFKNDKNEQNSSKIILFLNNFLKRIFLPKTIKHYEKLWKPFWVIINDNLLKFHDGDIREKVKNELFSSKL